MKPRVEAWLVNGALVAIAVVALLPLLWMMSMSVMAPGEASASPPPLVPASPTLDAYHELFTRGRVARNLSIAWARDRCDAAVAGVQRHGRLRVRQAAVRRPRRDLAAAGRRDAGAGQVAMIPLFLMLK